MSILAELGLDEDTVEWQDLAACKNSIRIIIRDSAGRIVSFHEPGDDITMPDGATQEIFDPMFDSYEMDSEPYPVRNATDEMCLSCPVRQVCLDFGVRNDEVGVWGGWYLTNGKIDDVRNGHKDMSVWGNLD